MKAVPVTQISRIDQDKLKSITGTVEIIIKLVNIFMPQDKNVYAIQELEKIYLFES